MQIENVANDAWCQYEHHAELNDDLSPYNILDKSTQKLLHMLVDDEPSAAGPHRYHWWVSTPETYSLAPIMRHLIA